MVFASLFYAGEVRAATCAAASSGGTASADWPSFCWFDFSSYNDTQARSAAGQSFVFTLNDGSTLSFVLKVSSSAATALTAVAAPSWSGSAVGNVAFLGIPGNPILYTATNDSTVSFTFSGITLTPPAGVAGGASYNFVAADGESTNANESLSFTTNGGAWAVLDQVPPSSGSLYPSIANTGTTFTETGVAGTVGGYIVGSTSATTVSTTLVAGGLQGAMFALRYSSISLKKTLANGRANAADQFTYKISTTASGNTLGTATSTGTGNGPFAQTSSFITTPQSLTLSEAMASGSASTLAGSYTSSLTCTNSTANSTTPLPTAVASTSYVLSSIAFGDVIACSFTNTAVPPVLAVTKSAPSPSLKVGVNSVYTLTVTNSGKGPAYTAEVKDQLPANLTFVSATGTNWTCANSSSLVTCNFAGGTIAAGGTSTIAMTVDPALASGGVSVTNYASIDPTGNTSPPTPGPSCTPTASCASAGPFAVIYIDPIADTGTATAGTVATPIANVVANDLLSGAAAVLGASGNATVAQSGTWPSGITLNATSGAIATTAAVAPGTYRIAYQLCDKNTPANCATVTDTVTVSASILPVADTGTVVAGTASTPIADVAANDTVNGAAAVLGTGGNATVAQSGIWPTGVALSTTTGAVTTTAAVAPGTYGIAYQLCDKNTPPDCATTTDTVTVSPSILPVADTGSAVAGTASTPIANVAANDRVNGAAAALGASGNASVAQNGTWPTGLALNTTTGAVTTTATVAPGTYSIVYQLCDKSSPPNCATAADSVTVTASILPVPDTGTAVAGTAGTAIANVAGNDTVNGAAAMLGTSGNATVVQSGTWPTGIALNTTTGAVTTTAAATPGTYSIVYQLCDKSTPAGCSTATDTVTVAASILPVADTGTAVAGAASAPIANVAANDTVNGTAATLGASGNATVAQSGTWPGGIALSTTTGAVTTTAAVAPGSYTIAYQLCDKNAPPNCATTTDTVTVSASIVAVADTGTAVAGTASTPIANVAANDTVNGAAAVLGASGDASVAQSGTWPTGIVLSATTGAVTMTAAVAPGTYSLVYQLCDKTTPPNCATATDAVTVTASIVPVADTGTAVAGNASTPIANVAVNDTVNGVAATLGAAGNATVTQAGTWTTGITLNTATGAITTTADVPPGVYSLQYELCDRNTPASCASTTDKVTVQASIIAGADTGTALAGTAAEPIANVATNDTVNGATATLGPNGNATVATVGTWPPGITLNSATGSVTTTAAVAPGSYGVQYQLCDRNAPPDCAAATDTIKVTANIQAASATGNAQSGTPSTPIATVVMNDSVNGAAATLGANGNATVSQSGTWATGIALNSTTGAVTTAAGVAPGTYSIAYQLCDKNTPPNCAVATDSVTVLASVVAVASSGTMQAGSAATLIANVAAGDTINGAPATLGANGNGVVSQAGTWPSGLVLNTNTGAVTATATVPPAAYSLQYQLCDRATPPTCAKATATVTVTANIQAIAATGSAIAGIPSTPVANVVASDFIDGTPASLGPIGNATVAQIGTWPSGVALNTASGAITTTAALPPGTHALQYQLCDKAAPPHCATATENISVVANIQAVADTGAATAGKAGVAIANVAANDSVNGALAVLGNSGNARVSQRGSWPVGIVLNSASGAISTTAAVPPGSYVLAYQLCDKNSPPDCATSTATIKVAASLMPTAEAGKAVAGTASTPIANVAANDTVNGAAATLGAGGNATVSTLGTWQTGITLNTRTGAVSLTAAVTPGSYSLGYQLCDRNTPADCATVTDTVVVAASIRPVAVTGTAVTGTPSTPVANIAAGNTVDSQAATLGSSGNATVAESGVWTTGISLNSATGAVTTAASVLPGTYSLSYELCDRSTPPNCAVAMATIIVKNSTGGSLLVSKSASTNQAAVGDSVQYRIQVRNPGTAAVVEIKLNDTLPLGFQLIAGTVLLGRDGATPTKSANPQGGVGPALTWNIGTLAAGEVVEIDYQVRIAAGAERGTGINEAQAVGLGVSSLVASARVLVGGGAFATQACVVGKIYVDCNGNRVMDAGEPGIPGVRLYFEDGTNLTSDENGNYSICGQRPITHVLKVDPITLPAGSRLVVTSSRNARDGDSLFVDLRDGELHRADFAEGSCTDKVMEDVKRRHQHGAVLAPLPPSGKDHIGVDFESASGAKP